MSTSLTAIFESRRDADMAVEHLVQEHGIERTDIFIAAAGDENSAGEEQDGSGMDDDRDDAALNGGISVSVEIEDDDLAVQVRDTFDEFNADSVVVD